MQKFRHFCQRKKFHLKKSLTCTLVLHHSFVPHKNNETKRTTNFLLVIKKLDWEPCKQKIAKEITVNLIILDMYSKKIVKNSKEIQKRKLCIAKDTFYLYSTKMFIYDHGEELQLCTAVTVHFNSGVFWICMYTVDQYNMCCALND